MSRKTATATKETAQPALFSEDRGPAAVANAAAAKASTTKTKTKPKADTVAKPAVNKGNLTVVSSTPANSLTVIVDLLKDPNLKPEAARLAFDMHKELLLEQRRLDFIHAKREMKRELPIINKDGKIEYKEDVARGKQKATLHFASYENLHDACAEPIYAHGFDVAHFAQPGATGMMNVITRLVHVNGHQEESVLPMPHDGSGGKSGAQGWHSAFSFGKRVNLIGILDIVTRAPTDRDVGGAKVKTKKSGQPQTIEGDIVVEDGDGRAGVATIRLCSDEELIKVRDAIAGCGVSDKGFCAHFNIKKVSELPADRFQDALVACKNHAERDK